jgi:hypothetical protein
MQTLRGLKYVLKLGFCSSQKEIATVDDDVVMPSSARRRLRAANIETSETAPPAANTSKIASPPSRATSARKLTPTTSKTSARKRARLSSFATPERSNDQRLHNVRSPANDQRLNNLETSVGAMKGQLSKLGPDMVQLLAAMYGQSL